MCELLSILSLFGTLLAAIAATGPFGHIVFPIAVGILAACMAVVISNPQEEDARSEPGMPTALSIVMLPGETEWHSTLVEGHQDAEHRIAITYPARRPRALVIGSGEVAQTLSRNLEKAGGYDVVGFVDDPFPGQESLGMHLLGARSDTSAIVRDHKVDAVFIANPPSWQQQLAETIVAENPGVSVNVVPSFQEALMRLNRVRGCGDIAVVSLTPATERVNEVIKRLFDLATSIIGIIITAPLLLLISILIKITSRGPVIFYQKRVGRYGKPFMMYKFRTMVVDAEETTGPILADGKADCRLTCIGRWLRVFRVDELPQFWNVIRGDMSLVGPRPERPYFVEQFEKRLPTYSNRHQLRPGITGLAQVYAGYHTDAEDKLRFDLIYISQQSFWLDVSILLRTIQVICEPHR